MSNSTSRRSEEEDEREVQRYKAELRALFERRAGQRSEESESEGATFWSTSSSSRPRDKQETLPSSSASASEVSFGLGDTTTSDSFLSSPPTPPPRQGTSMKKKPRRIYLAAVLIERACTYLTLRDIPALLQVSQHWLSAIEASENLWFETFPQRYQRYNRPAARSTRTLAVAPSPTQSSGSNGTSSAFSSGIPSFQRATATGAANVTTAGLTPSHGEMSRGQGTPMSSAWHRNATPKDEFRLQWEHQRKNSSTQSTGSDVPQGSFSSKVLGTVPEAQVRRAASGAVSNVGGFRQWKTPSQTVEQQLEGVTREFAASVDVNQQTDWTTASHIGLAERRQEVLRTRVADVIEAGNSLAAPLRTLETVDEAMLHESERQKGQIENLVTQSQLLQARKVALHLSEVRREFFRRFEMTVTNAVLRAENNTSRNSGNTGSTGHDEVMASAAGRGTAPMLSSFVQLEFYTLSPNVFGTPVFLEWAQVKRQLPIDELYFEVKDRMSIDAVDLFSAVGVNLLKEATAALGAKTNGESVPQQVLRDVAVGGFLRYQANGLPSTSSSESSGVESLLERMATTVVEGGLPFLPSSKFSPWQSVGIGTACN